MAREMKDSGVEWIGEIPQEWGIIRNKYILDGMYSGGTPTASNEEFYSDLGMPFVSISDMSTADFVYDTKKKLTKKGIEDKNLVILPEGTLLYSIYATIGAVAELKIEATVSQAILALMVNQSFNKQYYKYNLAAMRDSILNNANGNTQYNLNAEKVWNFHFVSPPAFIQDRIADYLDRRCAEIDSVIAKTEKTIEEYKALKQSIITEAVTKGIRPNRPMKDSGVEWIGEVPDEWQICKVRHIGSTQNGISKGGEYFGEGDPFVSYGDVYRNASLPNSIDGLVKSTEQEQELYSVRKGDIFFTRTSETIEEVGFSSVCEQTIPKATFAGFLIRLRPYNDTLDIGYSKYYFRSNHHRFYLVKQMNLVTRASLGQSLLKGMPVLVPPKSEQVEIAVYLDNKCNEIDKIIEIKQQLLTELETYKKSVIYEYVTGKKEACG